MPAESGGAGASESIDLMLTSAFQGDAIETAIGAYDRLAQKHAEVSALLNVPLHFKIDGLGDFKARVDRAAESVRGLKAALRTPADDLAAHLSHTNPDAADRLLRKAASPQDVLGEYSAKFKERMAQVEAMQKKAAEMEKMGRRDFQKQVEQKHPALLKSSDDYLEMVNALEREHKVRLQQARALAESAPARAAVAAQDLAGVADVLSRPPPPAPRESPEDAIRAQASAQRDALEAGAAAARKQQAARPADDLLATATAAGETADGLKRAREEWAKQPAAAGAAAEGIDRAAAAEAGLTAASRGKTAEVRAQIAALAALQKQTGTTGGGVDKLAEKEKLLSQAAAESSGPGGGILTSRTRAGEDRPFKTRRDLGGGRIEETTIDAKGEANAVIIEDHLAQKLADVRKEAARYKQAMRDAGDSTAKKASQTERHIAYLETEHALLAKQDYSDVNAKAMGAIGRMIDARKLDKSAIEQEMAAAERLGKQQVSLGEAKRRAQQAKVALADERTDPMTRVAQWRQYAAELDRVARTMRAEQSAPSAISGVEDRASAARIQARRLETAEDRKAQAERKRDTERAARDAEQQRSQYARSQQRGDNDRIRRAARDDIAIQERGSIREAEALERKTLALRAQAALTAKIHGMEGDARKLGEEAAGAEARALGIRAAHGRVVQQQADAERAAHAHLASSLPAGATATGNEHVTANSDGSRRTRQKFMMDVGGGDQTFYEVVKNYDKAGRLASASVSELTKNLEAGARTADWSARSFLKNTFVVTAWAASVGLLYGSLGLLRTGLGDAMELEHKTAILSTVFRGSADEAMALRDEVMRLAQAEGRSADEAVDAATRFSRLGLTRVQVQQAVAASLRAANVAEISAAEGAENLASIMSAFGLKASQLNSVLNQLNSISNTYNVTNKDLLNGIARVGALAEQARLPLSDLMGMIAVGVGGSGRPGAEFGNAIKALIVSISTPSIQDKLRTGFNFEVKGGEDIKAMSDILGELYQKFTDLNEAERLHLTQMLGQKQQASRLTLVLENYVAAQGLAIRALRDENSAERENANIRATLISQLGSLKAAFDRAATSMFASRDSSFLTTTLQTASRAIEDLMNILARMPNAGLVTAAVLAMVVVNMVRMASVADGAGKNMSFVANSMRHVALVGKEARLAISGMGAAFRDSVPGLRDAQAYMMRLERTWRTSSPALAGMVRGVRALGGALAFVMGAAMSLLRVMAGFMAFAAAAAVFDKIFGGRDSALDADTAALSRYADELERSAKAGEAYGKSADLFGSVAKTLPHRTEAQQKEDIATVAQAAEPTDQARQAALEKELSGLAEREDYAAYTARSEQLIAEARARASVEAQKGNVILRQMIQAEQELITRKQAAVATATLAGRDASRERQDLADAQKRMAQFSDQRNRNQHVIQDEVVETGAARWEKYAEERMKIRGETMDKMAHETPSLGAESDLAREIELLKAKRELEAQNIALIEESAKARKASADSAIRGAKSEVEAVRDTKGSKAALAAGLAARSTARRIYQPGAGEMPIALDPASDLPIDKQLDRLQQNLANRSRKVQAIESLRESILKEMSLRTNTPVEKVRDMADNHDWPSLGAGGFMGLELERLDAYTGPAASEGGKRLRSIFEQQKALGLPRPNQVRLQDISTAGGEARRDEMKAEYEVDAFRRQNAGYLALLEAREKLLAATRKQHTAQSDADEAEGNAAREKLAQLDRLIDARKRSQGVELTGARVVELKQQWKRDSANERAPYAVGLTDTEQMFRQARTVTDRLIPEHRKALDEFQGEQNRPVDQLKEQIILTEQLAYVKEQIIQLEKRNAEVQREKANEMLRQNAEASKAFLLAGRAEQMQAIYMAKYLQGTGQKKFTLTQTMFMSPHAREVGRTMLPNAMPDELNTPMQGFNRELAAFAQGIGGLREKMQEFTQTLIPRLNPEALEARALGQAAREDAAAALLGEQKKTTDALVTLTASALEAAKALDAIRGVKPADGADANGVPSADELLKRSRELWGPPEGAKGAIGAQGAVGAAGGTAAAGSRQPSTGTAGESWLRGHHYPVSGPPSGGGSGNWNDGWQNPLRSPTLVPASRRGNWNDGWESPLRTPSLVSSRRPSALPTPPPKGSDSVMRETSAAMDRLIAQAAAPRRPLDIGASLLERSMLSDLPKPVAPGGADAGADHRRAVEDARRSGGSEGARGSTGSEGRPGVDRLDAPDLAQFNRDVATASGAVASFADALGEAGAAMAERMQRAADQPQSGAPLPPQFAINLGGVSVQFADQYREIAASVTAAAVQNQIQQIVEPQIRAVLAEVRRLLPPSRASNVAPAG